MNREAIGGHPERVSNIILFINKYNWEGIKYPSGKDKWGKFVKNNSNLALYMLYEKEIGICPTYISKYNSTGKEQVTLLQISNEEGWLFPAGTKLHALIKGITSKSNGDFYYLNCCHSFRTQIKPKSHMKKRENKYYCRIVMLSQKDNILTFNQYMSQIKCHKLFMLTLNL